MSLPIIKLYDIVLKYGWIAIFAVFALEGTGMPFPVQVVFIACAFLIKIGRISFWNTVIIIALGNLFGNVLAYYAGRTKGKPFFDRYGRKIKLWREGFEMVKEWYIRYGGPFIIASRFIGIPRTPAIWASGIVGIDFKVYFIYSFLADFLWAYFYTFLTYKGLTLFPLFQYFKARYK
ncbi:membrane protein DedA, SNARE-associated domain [Caldanaerovirga acetigignens]|uniref:Membrane protein DedA, SNARE-associated domain n=1 Tax=Caldanaerovirga acetigignens TaxID=447595 RepID=A0A1M7HMV1_9FIRM|nr:VTT domain-containing protein [Caldanaerovirga acetigignens]SHM29784.1 membrane protein DedA, SNARE-associated domain [Caldanaerovirga acetigignens]